MLAYSLSGSDNSLYFFDDPPEGVLCSNCKTCLNLYYLPSEMTIHKSIKYDISFTYDGRPLVSTRFKEFCEAREYEGLNFFQVSREPCYFYFLPEILLQFDDYRRQTRFEKKCEVCGNYESIVGATPPYLKEKGEIKKGIFRTDLMFGSAHRKFPRIIIGTETYQAMVKKKFRGIWFHPVYE
jgi:hypothetical protein